MALHRLQITHLGPFEDITFTFDEQINVFVGPNSSGKSTTLMALAHLVTHPFVLPERLRRSTPATGLLRFVGRDGQMHEMATALPMTLRSPAQQDLRAHLLAVLGYSTFIPALRQSTSFRSDGTLRPAVGHVEAIPEELRIRAGLLPTDATLMRDEAILAQMVEFADRSVRRNDPSLRRLLTQIGTIASEILEGFPIEFWRIAEDREGRFPQFRTLDGNIALQVFSQGTQSVLQWLAYIIMGYARYYGYPANLPEQPGTIIIDEIDAHLHPTAQQRVFPVLRKHFPRLQIICSTHSPLMLAGLQAGQIQMLQRTSAGNVAVERNVQAIDTTSADALLKRFFGVQSAGNG